MPSVAPEDHATFWVIDSPVEDDNAHAAFVLREAAAAVERFRIEKTGASLHGVLADYGTHPSRLAVSRSVAYLLRGTP